MALMKIDANDGCVRKRSEFLEAGRQLPPAPVNIDVHAKHSSLNAAHVKGRRLLAIGLVNFNHTA
jgi:hypothetical protein